LHSVQAQLQVLVLDHRTVVTRWPTCYLVHTPATTRRQIQLRPPRPTVSLRSTSTINGGLTNVLILRLAYDCNIFPCPNTNQETSLALTRIVSIRRRPHSPRIFQVA